MSFTLGATDTEVEGELEVLPVMAVEGDALGSSGALYVFRPLLPLEVGRSYLVRIDRPRQAFLEPEAVVQATAPIDLERPEAIDATLHMSAHNVDRGPLDCCADESSPHYHSQFRCYATRVAVVLTPFVELVGAGAEQWLPYLRRLDGDGVPVGESFLAARTGEVISETQDEYCYEVEIERANDGRVVSMGVQCVASDGTPLGDIVLECTGEIVGGDGEPGSQPETGDQREVVSDPREGGGKDGCTIRSGASSFGSVVSAFTILVALVLRRRSAIKLSKRIERLL